MSRPLRIPPAVRYLGHGTAVQLGTRVRIRRTTASGAVQAAFVHRARRAEDPTAPRLLPLARWCVVIRPAHAARRYRNKPSVRPSEHPGARPVHRVQHM